MPPLLLLTRPDPLSCRFAGQIADLGLEVLISPIMRIVPVAHDAAVIAGAKGLVLTSVNAVPAVGQGHGRPAICVGPATAEAARKAGFDVTVGPGDADRMMPLLQDLGPGWVHPHGRHIARQLPVTGITVYDQVAQDLDDAAMAALAGDRCVLLPLFSPRSAQILVAQAKGARAPLWLAAISQAALDRWSGPFARRAVAPTPDAPGIIAALHQLLA